MPITAHGILSPASVNGITAYREVIGLRTLNQNGLVAYWKLDETSGTRYDSVGSSNLTDVNTVTYETGKISNAAKFTLTNSEALTVADNAALSMGDIDFTISMWVYWATKPSTTNVLQSLLFKGAAWDNSRAYHIGYWNPANGDSIGFYVSNGTTGTAVFAGSLGSPAAATWYHVIGWHDATANTVNIQVNNGTVDSESFSGGSYDDGNPFRLGSSNAAWFSSAYIDEVSIWKRVLTAGERAALYNSGSGLTYPFSA